MSPLAAPTTLCRSTPDDAAAIVRLNGDPAVMPPLLQWPHPSVEAMARLHPNPPRAGWAR